MRFLGFSDKGLASGGMWVARFSRKHIWISKCNFFGSVEDIKKIIVPALRRYGVRRASVSGSFARGGLGRIATWILLSSLKRGGACWTWLA